MTITFSKGSYEYFKRVISTGKLENYNDFLGQIYEGAVCCDLIILSDEGYEGENYCYGSRYMLDGKFYLLGKDTGYGQTKNGTPYDCVSGFYGYLKDTYEETVEGLIKQFNELTSEDPELREGCANTELTWEKEYE